MTALDTTFTATLQKSPNSFMALGDGTHKLAIPAGLRAEIGKQAGDAVTVHLEERIPPTPRGTS